jgi:hypothetical protein
MHGGAGDQAQAPEATVPRELRGGAGIMSNQLRSTGGQVRAQGLGGRWGPYDAVETGNGPDHGWTNGVDEGARAHDPATRTHVPLKGGPGGYQQQRASDTGGRTEPEGLHGGRIVQKSQALIQGRSRRAVGDRADQEGMGKKPDERRHPDQSSWSGEGGADGLAQAPEATFPEELRSRGDVVPSNVPEPRSTDGQVLAQGIGSRWGADDDVEAGPGPDHEWTDGADRGRERARGRATQAANPQKEGSKGQRQRSAPRSENAWSSGERAAKQVVQLVSAMTLGRELGTTGDTEAAGMRCPVAKTAVTGWCSSRRTTTARCSTATAGYGGGTMPCSRPRVDGLGG